MTTIHTGSNNGCAECGRDYDEVDKMVSAIQAAVEHGFDTRSDDAYEFFASEGEFGDPDDLSDYQYMHLFSQLENLYDDAREYHYDAHTT